MATTLKFLCFVLSVLCSYVNMKKKTMCGLIRIGICVGLCDCSLKPPPLPLCISSEFWVCMRWHTATQHSSDSFHCILSLVHIELYLRQTSTLTVSPHWKCLSGFSQQLLILKVSKVLLAVAPPDLLNTAGSPLTSEVMMGQSKANHVTGKGLGQRSEDQVHFQRGQRIGARRCRL